MLRRPLWTLLLLIVTIASYHDVEAQDLAKKTYTYKTVGSLPIRADVYRASDDIIRPAILYIHGGALIMGNRSWLNPVQVQKYLDAGYTIISIDYRLAPQTKLNEILEDVDEAYRWVRTDGPKLFRIDPNRIAVVGHSAGGYLALMAGVRLNPRPAAVVSFYGYGDIAGEWYSRPDAFYNRQPAVTKEEAQQAVGTRVIAEDPAGKRERFYLYTRQQGLWPREVVGHDPDKEPRYLTRCVRFAMSPRITRRRYCFMGIATQTSRLNSPCSWPRSWNAVESGTNSLRYPAGDMCSTWTCRIRRSRLPSIGYCLF